MDEELEAFLGAPRRPDTESPRGPVAAARDNLEHTLPIRESAE